MKKILFLLLFLPVFASAQTVAEYNFIAVITSPGAGAYGMNGFFLDTDGRGFTTTDVVVDVTYFFDANGQKFVVKSKSGSSPFALGVDAVGHENSPVTGIGQLTDLSSNGIPFYSGGVSAKVQASINLAAQDTIDQQLGGGGAVSSVNSQTGSVVLDADDIDDAATVKKFTTANEMGKLSLIQNRSTKGCYTVPVTYGLFDNQAIIDSALANYDCIILGDNPTQVISTSKPIKVPSNDFEIRLNGTLQMLAGDSVAITQDVVVGDDTINVTSTANFIVGQMVAIGDGLWPLQGGGTGQVRRTAIGGEIAEIINLTSVRLTEVIGDWTTLGGAFTSITEISSSVGGYMGHQPSGIIATSKTGFRLSGTGVIDITRDLQIDAETISTPLGTAFTDDLSTGCGVGLRLCTDTRIEGITVTNSGHHGIGITKCDDTFIGKGVKILNTHDKAIINLDGSELVIDGITIDSSEYEDGIALYQPPSSGSFSNILIRRTKRNAITCREPSVDGFTFHNIKIEDYESVGFQLANGAHNITIDGIEFYPRDVGTTYGFLATDVYNININNVIASGVDRAFSSSHSDSIIVSNFNFKGTGSTSAINIDSLNYLTMSNGFVSGFDEGVAQTNDASTNVRFTDVEFQNTTDYIADITNWTFIGCKGIGTASGWPYVGSANFSNFARLTGTASNISDITISSPVESGFLATKVTVSDRSYDPLKAVSNAFNVVGGFGVQRGAIGVQRNANDMLQFGPMYQFPADGSLTNFIGSDYAAFNGFAGNDDNLIIGARRNVSGSNIAFMVNTYVNPSMLLSGQGGFLGVSGGTSDDQDLRTLTSTPAALLFSHSSKPRFYLNGFNDDSATYPNFVGRRGRGTGAVPTAISTNDILAEFSGQGTISDGTFPISSTQSGGSIRVVASAAYTAISQPGRLEFWTVPTGSTNRVLRGSFSSEGGLHVGSGVVDPGLGIINAEVGYRVNNAATSGQVLRGNGSIFVASAIQVGDLPETGVWKVNGNTVGADASIGTVDAYPFRIATSNTTRATFPTTGGFSVGNGTFTAATGVINAVTGFRINNIATLGSYPRGDGTNIVLSTIQESDLPTRPATDITTADAGGHFTTKNLEFATQQNASEINTLQLEVEYTSFPATIIATGSTLTPSRGIVYKFDMTTNTFTQLFNPVNLATGDSFHVMVIEGDTNTLTLDSTSGGFIRPNRTTTFASTLTEDVVDPSTWIELVWDGTDFLIRE